MSGAADGASAWQLEELSPGFWFLIFLFTVPLLLLPSGSFNWKLFRARPISLSASVLRITQWDLALK